MTYTYDADGNVVTKTDARGITTCFGDWASSTCNGATGYDALNRLLKKTYSDGSTPTVQFGYDGVALSGCAIAAPGDTDTYPTGLRTSMCDGSGGTSWVHDPMGRVKQERRAIGTLAVSHYIDYGYNPDGSLKVLQTPPMKQLNYTFDMAGRATQLVDSTDNINFALNATYAPPGELAGATLGSATGFNGFTVSNAYNNRLQPSLLSASSPSATVFSDSFDFHLGAGDNGNVFKIVNNRDTTHGRDQNFTYDSLNRILSGQSSGTGSTSWGDTYVIDAWGNLTNMNPISGKALGQNFQAAPASLQNQLNGFCNDVAGNLVLNTPCPTPPFTPSYYYDAENRLVWTSGYRYVYDGNGERVEKCQAASPTTACLTSGTTGTLYWRGTGSDTLAETDLGGNDEEEYIFFNAQRIARRDTTSTGTTIAIHYYFSDHLGTHGVVENATGTVCEQDMDYYPYGGVENDYCNSTSVPQNYKFTGKERDTESGLDYFGARHNGSTMGRFMTPDPIGIMKQKFVDPQQWNMYAYVRNNPLRFIDPTGMYDVDCKTGDKKCNKAADNFEKQRQKDLKSKDQKVRDAAKAWGNRDEHNRVSVTFKPQAEVDRDAGTQPGYRTDAIVTAIGARGDDDGHIQAEFSESLGGSSLGQTIAHEGSHVGDDMNFLNSYDSSTGKYNPGLNFTHFDTEFQAFEAGSGVKSYPMFPKGPKGYQKLEDYIYRAYPNADDLVFAPSVFPQ